MDAELKKNLLLMQTKNALTNGVPTTSGYDSTSDSLEAVRDALRVPGADSANNNNESEVIGNKTDTNAGNSLFSRFLVPGADSAANTSIRDVVGNKTDTNAGNSLLARHLVPTADSANNVNTRDVIGNKTDTASEDPDVNNVSLMRLIKSLMRAWKINVPHTDVSLAAIDSVLTTDPSAGAPDAENTILDLAITAGTIYKIEDAILKVSSYGTGTKIIIRLWELLNGTTRAAYVNSKTVEIPTNYQLTTYLNLMDMFGKPTIVGSGIAITVITDAGNTGALTCSYSYSTGRTS